MNFKTFAASRLSLFVALFAGFVIVAFALDLVIGNASDRDRVRVPIVLGGLAVAWILTRRAKTRNSRE
jgi:hypothetical protein